MKIIASRSNPRFKALLKLAQSARERRRAGLSLLEGVHLVQTYLDHGGLPAELVVAEGASAAPEVAALLARCAALEPVVLADSLFAALSSMATPVGVMAAVATPRPPEPPQTPGPCLLLEDLQDPGNLGSILRTAAAAGIGEVYLSRHSVHAWSPRVLRAGQGAHFLLRIHEGVDLLELVRRFSGRTLAAAARAPRTIYDSDLRGQVALAFGNEGSGLSRALRDAADACISIPMPGGAESLNVAAAVAVCLFERVRQERFTGGGQ